MAWEFDFTYIRAGGRFYYLCTIMNLFSRKIIAFRLSARINTNLAIATLKDAIPADMIHQLRNIFLRKICPV